jgi:hypothetical protein
MSSLPRPLGSFTNWAILRLGELVSVACGFFYVLVQRDRLSILVQALALGLFFALLVYFHPLAFGFADDQGITFCRYFKLHFVPWHDITRIQRRQWNAFELVVLLGRRVTLSKTVKFPMNLSRQEVDATFKGSWAPEIVTWLIDHLPPTEAPKARSQEPEVRSQESK